MTPKLARITAKELIKILSHYGFVLIRSKGSHNHFLNKTTGVRVTIPVHAGKIIGPGLLRAILKQARIPPEAVLKK
jgi:predicted RNA binding protein YcfA (HicA-like mRNA interferase family)